MERILINLRDPLQLAAKEIKMYEKLLSACLHITFGPCSRTWFCSGSLGCPRGGDACVGLPAARKSRQTEGQLSSSPNATLHVFHMHHDSPLPPQRVWFSQKWEDLAVQCRNVEGLMTNHFFFPSILTGRVGKVFLLCNVKEQTPFLSWKSPLQLTRDIIFRPQCPISDFESKENYIHLYVWSWPFTPDVPYVIWGHFLFRLSFSVTHIPPLHTQVWHSCKPGACREFCFEYIFRQQ